MRITKIIQRQWRNSKLRLVCDHCGAEYTQWLQNEITDEELNAIECEKCGKSAIDAFVPEKQVGASITLENAHRTIELIHGSAVDHIHADQLHRFIDEQAERIVELETKEEKPRSANDWIYIYYVNPKNQFIYDRTVSRTGLGPDRAQERVEEYKKRGIEAFYIIGTTLPGAFS